MSRNVLNLLDSKKEFLQDICMLENRATSYLVLNLIIDPISPMLLFPMLVPSRIALIYVDIVEIMKCGAHSTPFKPLEMPL